MKNKDVYEFYQNAHKLKGLDGFNFVWDLQRNKRRAKQLIDEIESLREELPEYLKFKTEYLKLREDFADRDEQGNPLMMNIPNQPGMQTYKITEKAKEFGIEEKKLEKKYKETLEQQQKAFENYNMALDAECDVEFLYVSKKHVPINIKDEQLDVVWFMIDPKDKDDFPIKKAKK